MVREGGNGTERGVQEHPGKCICAEDRGAEETVFMLLSMSKQGSLSVLHMDIYLQMSRQTHVF